MPDRKEFELSEEDYIKLSKAAGPASFEVWKDVSERMGFDLSTVEQIKGTSKRFTAIATLRAAVLTKYIGQEWCNPGNEQKLKRAPYASFQTGQGFWLVLCKVEQVIDGADVGKLIKTPIIYHELESLA